MSNSTSPRPTKRRPRTAAKPRPRAVTLVDFGGDDLRADIELDELAGLQPECLGDLMEYADRLIARDARRVSGAIA